MLRRQRRRFWSSAWVAVLGNSLLGCLPVGEPPSGQQVVRDRSLTCAFFTPSESEAVPSYLFTTGPHRASDIPPLGVWVTDLYVHSYGEGAGTANGLSSLRPAVENVGPIQLGAIGRSPASDNVGRLFLTTLQDQPGSSSGSYQLTRFDPRSGTVGPDMAYSPRFSASRARVFAGDRTNGVLVDPDGSHELPGASDGIFIGEDLYYLAVVRPHPFGQPTSSTLIRIKPGAEAEVLRSVSSSGSLTFTAIEGSQTQPHLLIHQTPAPSPQPGFFMLDLDTLAASPLPSDLANASLSSTSPSGRWLLFATWSGTADEPPTETQTLLDWTTGARLELPPLLGDQSPIGLGPRAQWRPDLDELWIPSGPGAVRVVAPGDGVRDVSLPAGLGLTLVQRADTQDYSAFMPDGRHCFLRGSSYDGPLYVGSVDALDSAPVQINPQGTWTKDYWDIGDGRFLIGASVEDDSRQELLLVDPGAGTSRSLAGGGQLVAVGSTRALALLAWDGGRSSGTLTLIDLASGGQTVLAEDVYLAALDPGHFADVAPGTDPLAVGTQIAFLSRGRFASSYDGLWVTRLP
jgi:hypothetical protein